MEQLIKMARKSGQLNLTARGIGDVPDDIWNINVITGDERRGLEDCEEKWWEQTPLTKLYLSSNKIRCLSPAIENLQALTILELNDNDLVSLPETMGKLRKLSKLNISRNEIENLPDSFFQLKDLRQFIAHHNVMSKVTEDIANLSVLEMMDLSHNKLTSVTPMIGFLSQVTNLNLSYNKLSELPAEIGRMSALQMLDVSSNQLKNLPEAVGALCHLEQLFVQQNKLATLPLFSGCTCLKELHVSNNAIEEFPVTIIETLLGLTTLDLKCNKLSTLSPRITMIQGLERLDLSNNNIASLPHELGTLAHLKGLGVEGNPLRAIRRDILKKGTVHLLKWMQERLGKLPENAAHKELSGEAGLNDGSDLAESIEKLAIKRTHALELSKRALTDVPEEVFRMAAECEASTIDISKNALEFVPKGLEIACPILTELKLGFNKISSLPGFLELATRLTILDVRNNLLSDIPIEMSSLSSVREVNLSFNRFSCIPKVVSSWNMLEILFASDNKIEQLDVAELQKLKHITVLDLRNNSIPHVPPHMGNMQQLRSLQLEGNLFRIPRPAVLAKGTAALLEFLRDRIPR